MRSVRLNIGRSGEDGDTTIEIVANNLRHLKVVSIPPGGNSIGKGQSSQLAQGADAAYGPGYSQAALKKRLGLP